MVRLVPWLVGVATAFGAAAALGAGEAERGARAFRACIACHSIEPGEQRTGPSLAGLWGRKAGSLEAFGRYSAPLQRSGIVWNEKTLDRFLADPMKTVPGTTMTYAGVEDPRERADLIAYLKKEGKCQGS